MICHGKIFVKELLVQSGGSVGSMVVVGGTVVGGFVVVGGIVVGIGFA